MSSLKSSCALFMSERVMGMACAISMNKNVTLISPCIDQNKVVVMQVKHQRSKQKQNISDDSSSTHVCSCVILKKRSKHASSKLYLVKNSIPWLSVLGELFVEKAVTVEGSPHVS